MMGREKHLKPLSPKRRASNMRLLLTLYVTGAAVTFAALDTVALMLGWDIDWSTFVVAGAAWPIWWVDAFFAAIGYTSF